MKLKKIWDEYWMFILGITVTVSMGIVMWYYGS